MTLAASFVIASAAFTSSYAQTSAVSEKTFDWIFFAIVGIPLVLAIVDTVMNDGKRGGRPDDAGKRYPATVSNASAAAPLTAWHTGEDEEAVARPEPKMPGY